MAIGVLLDIPGATAEVYHDINRKAFGNERGPDTPPDGLIIHTAGKTQSGFRIFDVWESKEDFDRFTEDFIMPATEGMDLPQTPPEVYELTNVIGSAITTSA